jgi:hypothetical protein
MSRDPNLNKQGRYPREPREPSGFEREYWAAQGVEIEYVCLAAPVARKPYPSYAAEEATRSKQVAPAQAEAAPAPADLRPYNPTEAMRWAAKQIDPALTHEHIRALWCAMWSAAPAAPAPDRVPMPQNDDQAAAMVSLGMAWLEQHAPERLAKPATLPPPFDEVGDPPRFVYTAEQMRDYALAAVAQAKPAPAPEQLTDADLLDLTPERDFGLTPEIEAYVVASMRAAIAKATGGQA